MVMVKASKELKMVMPVYNEEGAVGEVIKKWAQKFQELKINYEIHVYNDGSKDNTAKILDLIKINNPNINLVIHNKINSGHGPTILLGYRECSCGQNSSNSSDAATVAATWIFQTDSDDETSPEDFIKLWDKRDNFDFLIGIRSGDATSKRPLARKIISFVSRISVWFFYGQGVSDINTPFRLMRIEKFKDYYKLIPEDTFAPNVILSGIACLKKFRIFETNITTQNRKTGEVSIKKWKLLKASCKSFWQTIKFRFTFIFGSRFNYSKDYN
ncbi:MAG: glycosyltransferase family 2 protein [Oligoflexia bacterium]|nr:glycosyltransferase family 2 protein [Oligoflexia bacterium]